MKALKKNDDITNKVLFGLEKTYEKLIDFKKSKKTELVILKDGKVVKVKPS